MYIFIDSGGDPSLRDSENMRAFAIVEEIRGSAARWLADNALPAAEQHYWLDAKTVIELSGRASDDAWVGAFREMLASVEAYGYSDMQNQRIKAHLEPA